MKGASFYSRRVLIGLTFISVVGFIMSSVLGYVLVKNGISLEKKTAPAVVREQSPVEISLAKAERYFVLRSKEVSPAQLLLLNYLERAYNISPQLGYEINPVTIPQEDSEHFKAEVNNLMRIVDPKKTVISLGNSPTSVAIAVNCDRITPPVDYQQRLVREVGQGGYKATHAALSVHIMKELRCPLGEDLRKLDTQLAEKLVTISTSTETIPDLRYEATAFLLLLGHGNQVQQAWIDTIMKEQRSDGGWFAGIPDEQTSHEHASVLAYWILLQYSQKTSEPLVRR